MSTHIQRIWPILFTHRIVDGDTYWLRIDQQFNDWKLIEVRLDGYDTPEKQGTAGRRVSVFEKSEALRARDYAAEWFYQVLEGGLYAPFVETKPDPEKYGRWLGSIWAEKVMALEGVDDLHLGENLREQKLASVWPTRWYQEFDN